MVRRVAEVNVCAAFVCVGVEERKEKERQRTERRATNADARGNNNYCATRRRRRRSRRESAYITRVDLDPHVTLCLADLRLFFFFKRVTHR